MQGFFHKFLKYILLFCRRNKMRIKKESRYQCIDSACRKSICRLAICTKGVRLWGTPGEGSPPKNSPLDCFSPLLRSFGTKISQPAGCDEGAAPQPRRLLKKAGENFWLFFYRKTVYRQTEAVQIGPPGFCALSVHDVVVVAEHIDHALGVAAPHNGWCNA